MDIIEKLNQEFDEVQNKNIKLEKENLELYKEIHKLKFKMCIEDELDYPVDYYRQDFEYWSSQLEEAVEYGLEKNVILKEIWEYPDDEPWGLVGEIEILDGNIDCNGEKRELIDSFSGGVYH
mgnify:CR=1 FL=1